MATSAAGSPGKSSGPDAALAGRQKRLTIARLFLGLTPPGPHSPRGWGSAGKWVLGICWPGPKPLSAKPERFLREENFFFFFLVIKAIQALCIKIEKNKNKTSTPEIILSFLPKYTMFDKNGFTLFCSVLTFYRKCFPGPLNIVPKQLYWLHDISK